MDITLLLQKCCEVPGITLKPCTAGAELVLHRADGCGRMRFFPVFAGVALAYISIAAPTWPAPDLGSGDAAAKGPLLINYCVQGRCEVALNNKNYVYLSDKQLSLTECFAQNRYIYPRRLYEGLEFFIDLSAAANPDACLMRDFALDLRCLPQRWCPDGSTYISGGSPDLQQAFRALWALGVRDDARSLFARKTAVLTLLEQLRHAPDIPAPQTCTFYTESQVAIAKQIEALITADLARHIPAHALAARFSVSETSLKNYFRGVYGQNLSVYRRWNTAAPRIWGLSICRRVRYNRAVKPTILRRVTHGIYRGCKQSLFLQKVQWQADFRRTAGRNPAGGPRCADRQKSAGPAHLRRAVRRRAG